MSQRRLQTNSAHSRNDKNQMSSSPLSQLSFRMLLLLMCNMYKHPQDGRALEPPLFGWSDAEGTDASCGFERLLFRSGHLVSNYQMPEILPTLPREDL